MGLRGSTQRPTRVYTEVYTGLRGSMQRSMQRSTWIYVGLHGGLCGSTWVYTGLGNIIQSKYVPVMSLSVVRSIKCPPLFVLSYHWLPLATIDIVGDNREFEV